MRTPARSSKPTLADAVLALSDQCDGARLRDQRGWNAADAEMGNRLARLPYESWTLYERKAIWSKLFKYATQLAAVGIAVSDIPLPTEGPAVRPEPVAPVVEQFTARVAGPCAICGDDIAAGGTFTWGFERGSRVHYPACPPSLRPVRVMDEPPAPALAPPRHTMDSLLGAGGYLSTRLPGYEPRPQQVRGASLFHEAFRRDSNAVAQLGTGTGKSLAGMIAAAETGRRTIIATGSKALQDQYGSKDGPFCQENLPPEIAPKVAVLKGRRNYACLMQVEQARGTLGEMGTFKTAEAASAFADLRGWLDETKTGDLEAAPVPVPPDLWSDITVDSETCLGDKCTFFRDCFVEKAKARARDADIIIVNYHLLLTDAMLQSRSDGNIAILPDADQVVLDEAHNLEDIATTVFGDEIRMSRWERIRRGLERLTVRHKEVHETDDVTKESHRDWELARSYRDQYHRVGDALRAVFDRLRERLDKADKKALRLGDERILVEPLTATLAALRVSMEGAAPHWLDENQRELWERLTRQVEKLTNSFELVAKPGLEDVFVRYMELDDDALILWSKPIDVSELLRAALFERYKSVAAMSATIAVGGRLDHWMSRVGCDSDLTYVADSPFDYGRNCLLYLPAEAWSHRLDPSRALGREADAYWDDLAAAMGHLVEASDGRAFLLFTSNRALSEVYRRIAVGLMGRFQVLRQGELPRPELVRRFKERPSVLFGTKSFWEGVDVQGEALSLVVINACPFTPPDDPVFAAKKENVNRKALLAGARPAQAEWAWWHQLAIPNATIQMMQAFGRLIRTKSDKGVVAILDGRLVRKPYGKVILDSLPPAKRTSSLNEVKQFYRDMAGRLV